MPPGVVAHRLGDVVFTYHGIDLTQTDGQLWVFILSPDPDAQVGSSSNGTVVVGLADGYATTEFDAASIGAKLAEQNKLRATLGLPPLPDPTTVTHARPAVRGTGP